MCVSNKFPGGAEIVCGSHFYINVDTEQLLLGAGGQSVQVFGPLIGFLLKAMLKYMS